MDVKTKLKQLEKLAEGKAVKDAASFKPTLTQNFCKSRFWKELKRNPLMSSSLDNVGLDAMVRLSGAGPNFYKWTDEPGFLDWWCYEGWMEDRLSSIIDTYIVEMEDIVAGGYEEKILTAKDKIAAFRLLCELADKFPNKRREFVYVDKELGRLSEAETDRQLMEAKQQLASPGARARKAVEEEEEIE